MSLTTTGEIVRPASAGRRGVGAFNVILLEHAEALIAAADDAGLAVILQISENCVRYHGALAPLGTATLDLARRARVPVAVHLDHATSVELVHEAVELGFSSVMYDGAALDYAANVARTAEVVAHCHERGVSVEAELGEVGGKDGAHAPGVRTDPGEARAFALDTGVDALAVAVGSSHAMTTREAVLDESLIQTLHESVDVPLVLHGSSGVPDDGLARAVRAGIAKVNIATHLNAAFTRAVRERLARDEVVDPRTYIAAGRDAVTTEAARMMRLLHAGAVPG
ncbi:class II fructose-bisphosphate aldolase [Actinobacteria bacterium YIM 96077]|uniref:Fructose-bisphosphate aldolase n=1 Tax=Phytoactinopolyspora halophila TaxID=1981511 RepID=A0A329QZQ0_9ACTN|nr:class II fructose-bisphosphate aldolase [Phytoactinopolyspora halophila]AYY11683.1 class II fructose-bisphosphate aldolase [Actinobacteria bacterium YIM 96077]RAW17884.1 fructose-bisphosphate aldolase [Phytoactinopolyspora halophila]